MTDEFDLIHQLFKPLADDPAALGLSDDAAILPAGEGALALAKDVLIENVHFRSADPLDLVARKALRVNLSDLAAMGAAPRGYLLGLALPARLFSAAALRPFADGLRRDQDEFGIALLGGDTTKTDGPMVVSVTVLGRVPRTPIARSGARPGDAIYVSGTVGDAGLGLKAFDRPPAGLSSEAAACLKSRYQLPIPRIELGKALAGVARAGLDVSDGLIADLGHLAAASGLCVEIAADDIPLSDAARDWLRADPGVSVADLAVFGDDYEIAFAVPPGEEDRVRLLAMEAGVGVTRIGQAAAGSGVKLLSTDGSEIVPERRGWNHGA